MPDQKICTFLRLSVPKLSSPSASQLRANCLLAIAVSNTKLQLVSCKFCRSKNLPAKVNYSLPADLAWQSNCHDKQHNGDPLNCYTPRLWEEYTIEVDDVGSIHRMPPLDACKIQQPKRGAICNLRNNTDSSVESAYI